MAKIANVLALFCAQRAKTETRKVMLNLAEMEVEAQIIIEIVFVFFFAVRFPLHICVLCAYVVEKIFKFSRHFHFIFKQLLILVSIAFASEFMPPHKAPPKWWSVS